MEWLVWYLWGCCILPCAWINCIHCCFLSLKKHIFGKCPTLKQILHLCQLAGHLKLSLCLKSPHHVQSPLALKFCLPFLSFHGGWLFLLGCDDCCCWFDWLYFCLPFGFWYFFWVTCVLWWQSKLTEAFAPVFALVDKYCPVALFCSIVFAKFLTCWGLKYEGLASSFWLLLNHSLCSALIAQIEQKGISVKCFVLLRAETA